MRVRLIRLVAVVAASAALTSPAGTQNRVDIHRIVRDAHRMVARALEHARHADDQRDRGGVEQVERTTKTLKIGATGQLALSNISGDIVITAGGRDGVTLEAVKRGRGRSDAEAKQQLDLVAVEITERAGRAEVRARYKEGERHINVSVDYTVTAPAGTVVTVRSVSGDIKVSGIKGELDIETVSGDVTLDAVGQLGRAKSVSGDVSIAGAEVDGTLDASSVSGDVMARAVKARRIEFETVSGDVELLDAKCDAARAKTVSGDVSFSGGLGKGGRYEFTSHSGDVRLTLAGDTGFAIEASTFSGSIRSDLPITIGGGAGAAVTGKTIRGTYGDGSATVDVTTFSGSVIIRKR